MKNQSAQQKILISLQDLSFTYTNATQACLQNINLNVEQGEFILLTGKSGSGKSSLTSCINGLIPSFYTGILQGLALFEDKKIIDFASYELSQKIGSVFQDPRSQFFTTDTISELAFSCENFGVEPKEIHRRILSLSKNLGIEKILGRNLFELSSGEKQKLAIASVLMLEPKVILFDEPSANLDYATCLDLAKILQFLKNAGHTIIIAEHRIFYLKHLVDRMCFVENQTIMKEFSSAEFLNLTQQDLKILGLRNLDLSKLSVQAPLTFLAKNPNEQEQKQEIAQKPAQEPLTFSKENLNEQEQEILKIANLDFGYHKKNLLFKDANFSAKAGNIVAIIGANGAGKTSLAKIISGLNKAQKGEISIKGMALKRKKLKNHITFVMQDADYQLFTESLEQELTIGNEKISDLETKIADALKKLNLEHLKHKHPASLSGGEKQRLTIAQALVRDSDLIILDEPTSGLDALNMQKLTQACVELASAGKVVLIITHDYEFILQSCNKILFIKPDKTLEYSDFNESTKDKVADIFNSMQQNWTNSDDRNTGQTSIGR